MREHTDSPQMQSDGTENGTSGGTGDKASKSAWADHTAVIRTLNDRFRQSFVGGTVLITSGTEALPDDVKLAVMQAVQSFNEFTPDNDPAGEHDFGSFEMKGDTFFWKIDCYDTDMLGHSPDATDPAVTRRVLTIMKAEEY